MTTPLPITDSEIASQAFIELELRPLSSYGDDTEEAVLAAQRYPRALGMVLESYDWSFVRRLVRLPRVVSGSPETEPDADLPYTFSLPAEFKTLRRVFPAGNPDWPIKWRRDGDHVRADAEDVQAIITRDIKREADLPDLVRHAVALQLAVLLAPKWVTTRTKRADMRQDLADALTVAKSADRTSASDARLDGLDESTGWDWLSQVTR
ncbi:hypothetical protein CDO87_03420 [Sagittula sp. P11]|uniref:hypothetical protein n=1 Tax=Sagittula sp. P11 TaxID=2009329 RepID=UPI000C2D1280|nr:hypothetical protein [Sagittula sp. P11]AUC52295.1 hypothetical protein CDO87_03420 [Sagittula sp. P11]